MSFIGFKTVIINNFYALTVFVISIFPYIFALGFGFLFEIRGALYEPVVTVVIKFGNVNISI